jgi:hypothetical protein
MIIAASLAGVHLANTGPFFSATCSSPERFRRPKILEPMPTGNKPFVNVNGRVTYAWYKHSLRSRLCADPS